MSNLNFIKLIRRIFFAFPLFLLWSISSQANDTWVDTTRGAKTQLNQEGIEAPKTSTIITVIDFAGKLIELEKPAEKVIALSPHIVENIYSLGAQETLMGVVSYSDYPLSAKQLPRVGDFSNLNIEKIVEMTPDLIIAWGTGNSRSDIIKLQSLGFPVYIDEPKKLIDVAKSIEDLGSLLGKESIAQNKSQKYIQHIRHVKKTNKKKIKVSVFYQIWPTPLQTISGKHLINDILSICGGNNIFEDEDVIAPIISIESILKLNPRAIIAGGDDKMQLLEQWEKWSSVDAVSTNNLFVVNPDVMHRHTLRLLFGVDSVCRIFDQIRIKSKN